MELPVFPGYPPPKSSRLMSRPRERPRSKRSRAMAMARRNTGGSAQPEPTWKLMPTTFIPRLAASLRSRGASVPLSHPNFIPSWHWATWASQRIRSTILFTKHLSLIINPSTIVQHKNCYDVSLNNIQVLKFVSIFTTNYHLKCSSITEQQWRPTFFLIWLLLLKKKLYCISFGTISPTFWHQCTFWALGYWFFKRKYSVLQDISLPYLTL